MTDKPSDATCFPILAAKNQRNARRFRDATCQLPRAAVDAIETLQPYHREDYRADPLWKLNKLANTDKHRVIPAYGTTIDFKIPRGIAHTFGTANDRPAVFMHIDAAPLMKAAPAPVGDIVFGVFEAGIQVNLKGLSDLRDYVRDSVFPLFAPFLPG